MNSNKSYYGSNMDNYSDDYGLWKNLSESFTQEEKKEIMKMFVKVIMSPIRLTSRERKAYLMKYYKNLDNVEISEFMGVSVRTVNNYISNANRKISKVSEILKESKEIIME